MAEVGSPTNVQRSAAAGIMEKMESAGITDPKIKGFVSAALASVGNYSHGKGYAPSGVAYKNWGANPGDTCSNEGLNCWTALIWWAFTGGAIDQPTINQYSNELRGVAGEMEKENHIMYSFLRANHTVDINKGDTPPIGRTIFFGDTTWKRPLNHVVISVGDGYVVSQQSLFIGVKGAAVDKISRLNPTIQYADLVTKGLTHISKINYIAESGEDTPRIKMTTKPFWELPRTKWVA